MAGRGPARVLISPEALPQGKGIQDGVMVQKPLAVQGAWDVSVLHHGKGGAAAEGPGGLRDDHAGPH